MLFNKHSLQTLPNIYSSLEFNGSSQHAVLPFNQGGQRVNFGVDDNFAIECWYKTSDTQSLNNLIATNRTGSQLGWQLTTGFRDLNFAVHDGAKATFITSYKLPKLENNSWYHILINYIAFAPGLSYVEYYINGFRYDRVAATLGEFKTVSNGLQIAGNTQFNTYSTCELAYLRFYSRNLSDTEVNRNLKNPGLIHNDLRANCLAEFTMQDRTITSNHKLKESSFYYNRDKIYTQEAHDDLTGWSQLLTAPDTISVVNNVIRFDKLSSGNASIAIYKTISGFNPKTDGTKYIIELDLEVANLTGNAPTLIVSLGLAASSLLLVKGIRAVYYFEITSAVGTSAILQILLDSAVDSSQPKQINIHGIRVYEKGKRLVETPADADLINYTDEQIGAVNSSVTTVKKDYYKNNEVLSDGLLLLARSDRLKQFRTAAATSALAIQSIAESLELDFTIISENTISSATGVFWHSTGGAFTALTFKGYSLRCNVTVGLLSLQFVIGGNDGGSNTQTIQFRFNNIPFVSGGFPYHIRIGKTAGTDVDSTIFCMVNGVNQPVDQKFVPAGDANTWDNSYDFTPNELFRFGQTNFGGAVHNAEWYYKEWSIKRNGTLIDKVLFNEREGGILKSNILNIEFEDSGTPNTDKLLPGGGGWFSSESLLPPLTEAYNMEDNGGNDRQIRVDNYTVNDPEWTCMVLVKKPSGDISLSDTYMSKLTLGNERIEMRSDLSSYNLRSLNIDASGVNYWGASLSPLLTPAKTSDWHVIACSQTAGRSRIYFNSRLIAENTTNLPGVYQKFSDFVGFPAVNDPLWVFGQGTATSYQGMVGFFGMWASELPEYVVNEISIDLEHGRMSKYLNPMRYPQWSQQVMFGFGKGAFYDDGTDLRIRNLARTSNGLYLPQFDGYPLGITGSTSAEKLVNVRGLMQYF